MKVIGLVLTCAVLGVFFQNEIVHGAGNPQAKEARELIQEPPMDMAKEAAVNVDKGVRDDFQKREDEESLSAEQLEKLLPALKAAAVGVAEKSAADAVVPATKKIVEKIKHAEHARKAAQQTEAAQERLAATAHAEEAKDLKVMVAAYKAEASAAKAATKKTKYKLRLLRKKVSKLHSWEEAAAHPLTDAKKMKQRAAEISQHKAYAYAEEADAAEEQAAAAKAALQSAIAKEAQARNYKERALQVEQKRIAAEKELDRVKKTPDSAPGAKEDALVEETKAPSAASPASTFAITAIAVAIASMASLMGA